MKFSSLPFLLTALLLFVAIITRRTVRLGRLKPINAGAIYGVVFLLALWSIVSSGLALSGFYKSSTFLTWLPGLWFPLIPLGICIIPFFLSSRFRQTLCAIVDATPATWFIYLQALRITAVGTLYKTLIGEFPVHIELALGVPDLCFGLSALYMAKRVRSKTLSDRTLIIWNLVGAGIVIIPGELLIQMGLPGPMQVFSSPPTTEVMFEFPLALAPTVVVPLLVVMNGLIAWRLIKRRTTAGQGEYRQGEYKA
ncbi:MAG: hypothetical protein QNJ46_25280 [Leptolyngbyaceae cyanobacterium MO_188.B28]|nr:hypothetical protein [Leptolyngbyaceae cyanobacterium MO_188.B28]